MKKVLILIPQSDFDPTEAAVPWKLLSDAGVQVQFATPKAQPAQGDLRMIDGHDLGLLKRFLVADKNGQAAYLAMQQSTAFQNPLAWESLRPESVTQDYDALLLPGGHATGMKTYLESKALQQIVASFFAKNRPVAAICHGVVLAARSQDDSGRSVLHGRKTTALLESQELLAWRLTRHRVGDYYRTYPETVESEVRSKLASGNDFLRGPSPLFRDNPKKLGRGFTVRDGNYLSARWPGDAHAFATELLRML